MTKVAERAKSRVEKILSSGTTLFIRLVKICFSLFIIHHFMKSMDRDADLTSG